MIAQGLRDLAKWDSRDIPQKIDLLRKRVDVLDKGWIELQDMMGDDLAIVNAARVSHLGESGDLKKDKDLLFYLMRHRHTTPFEMVEFKFRVRAPLLVWWQWVRHRTMHYNAQSGRYTPFKEDDFYLPSVWRKQAQDNKQGSDGAVSPDNAKWLDKELLNMYQECFWLYEQALAAGVAKEQARLFLPGFSVYYTWMVKVDAHNLMHFLRLRMASNAQEEIRVYAQAIHDHFFAPALPWTAEAFKRYVLE